MLFAAIVTGSTSRGAHGNQPNLDPLRSTHQTGNEELVVMKADSLVTSHVPGLKIQLEHTAMTRAKLVLHLHEG